MSIKINKLEIENIKRVKAVKIEPTENGLTVIGGRNNQGKTSVLDSIAWALGGEKYRPSQAQRDGSVLPPELHITLSNGLVVERKGKNSDLKVLDPSGRKGGQTLLNEFVEQLALDLPKFMEASGKEKARTLLHIIGVEEELARLELEEKTLYQERLAIGRIADQKSKYAKEMKFYEGIPNEPVSASELIFQQQAILAKNGENQRKRDNVLKIRNEKNRITENVNRLRSEWEQEQARLIQIEQELKTAEKSALELQDESTEELENNIRDIDELNAKIRANLDREKAEEDAKRYEAQYSALSSKIEDLRDQQIKLLNGANLPLSGLSVKDYELTYHGQKWDNMSGSDQLKVATAIVRKLNPKCGFVLLDKLEQMDIETMKEFGFWLESEGLQAIATRVSTGDECSLIIEDGYVQGQQPFMQQTAITQKTQNWKAGEF